MPKSEIARYHHSDTLVQLVLSYDIIHYLRFSGLGKRYSETTLVSHLWVLLILESRFLIRYRADHQKIKQKKIDPLQ
jgi:hypothetical protein